MSPLIVGKEFSGFDRTNEGLDLLAVDRAGRLVVIELKGEDSGADVHWQAIKQASYLQRASASDIVKLTADGHGCSPEELGSVDIWTAVQSPYAEYNHTL